MWKCVNIKLFKSFNLVNCNIQIAFCYWYFNLSTVIITSLKETYRCLNWRKHQQRDVLILFESFIRDERTYMKTAYTRLFITVTWILDSTTNDKKKQTSKIWKSSPDSMLQNQSRRNSIKAGSQAMSWGHKEIWDTMTSRNMDESFSAPSTRKVSHSK